MDFSSIPSFSVRIFWKCVYCSMFHECRFLHFQVKIVNYDCIHCRYSKVTKLLPSRLEKQKVRSRNMNQIVCHSLDFISRIFCITVVFSLQTAQCSPRVICSIQELVVFVCRWDVRFSSTSSIKRRSDIERFRWWSQ